ncbi:IBR domain-containing protein [Colletotrichum fioriniae PJ7]|uniref:RBR-type E3 ubiquitin transferase n=1 Tax=Colletotrichum fioriniae PJ7 TaxID=1445577 RepID=A0A010Q6M3_9PEZI|nr:IBR domain-containing protein [Colletotrichum fioriniae PJ7]
METATNVPARLEDYVGFYGDPFVTLRDFDDDEVKPTLAITSKETTTHNPADANDATEANPIQEDENEDEARWTEYNPPASLRTAPNLTNTVALEILQVSIENLQARAAEENHRRQLEEEERQREAEAANANDEGDGTVKEPYLPIIITSPGGEPGPSSAVETGEDDVEDLKLFPEMTGAGDGSTLSQGLIVLPFQPKKRSRFALTRILQKISEKDTAKTFHFGGNSSKTSLEAAAAPDEPGVTVTEKLKKAPVTVECVSCLDDFSPKKVIKVTCHSYCPGCFERLISTAVQNEHHWPPKCCLNPIPTRLFLRKISPELAKTCKDRAIEWAIPVADRIYCAEPACGLWVRPEHVDPASRRARCRVGHISCSMCRGPHHADDADCPLDRDLALTNALAEEEGWQHCGRCQALVEHREACQHMTCRCGYQFCYVCGLRWRTCACTMHQLELIKNGAAARRRERLQREAEAEEELRDALRQIEEFEREEALKAELLRLEMERLEEEARIAWEEERARLESLRRYEVEVRFQELRELMDQIHDLQEFLVRYQHDKEKELAANEEATSTAELESKQEAEQQALVETAADKLAAKVKSLTAEYGARVLAEQRTEEAYLRQLESFFADRPSSEARIEALMREFRGTMDKGWRAWERWRDEEVARYKLKVEEERTIREEIMYSVRKRHEERLERARAELERRQAAEIKWVTLVVAERTRMLGVMERAELEGEGMEMNEALVGVTDDDEAGSS